jgi:hypothetical protein
MSVVLATVSGLHEVAAWRSHCLFICRVHHWVILLAIFGGIVGWGTTGDLSGLCSSIWHSSGDRRRHKSTVGWRVASRTLGQGFQPLRCWIAPRIRSQGLEPHMSNQGTLERRYRDPHSERGLHLDRAAKTIRPSRDRTPGIVPH